MLAFELQKDASAFGLVLCGAVRICAGDQRDAILLRIAGKPAIESDLFLAHMRLYFKIVVVFQQSKKPRIRFVQFVQWTGEACAGLNDIVRNLQKLGERDPVCVVCVLFVCRQRNQAIQLTDPVRIFGDQDRMVIIADFLVRVFCQINLDAVKKLEPDLITI